MQRVTYYKTTDGKLFEDISEAVRHEVELEFIEWYEQNPLSIDVDGLDAEVDARQVIQMLYSGREIISKLVIPKPVCVNGPEGETNA